MVRIAFACDRRREVGRSRKSKGRKSVVRGGD